MGFTVSQGQACQTNLLLAKGKLAKYFTVSQGQACKIQGLTCDQPYPEEVGVNPSRFMLHNTY
jgi:hypothetical protein